MASSGSFSGTFIFKEQGPGAEQGPAIREAVSGFDGQEGEVWRADGESKLIRPRKL